MDQLRDILYGVGIKDVIGTTENVVHHITIDSRKVERGGMFIAIRGTETDGHHYINKAVELGATTVISEETPNTTKEGVSYILVKDSKEAAGVIADNFYDNPSSELSLIGITGTNGKTTIATLCYRLFKSLDIKTGLLSTIENRIDDTVVASTHTTPDPISLNALLRQMVDAGCRYCFMEVSSHAVDQRRIAGLNFLGGVFTNLSHDHLDYHKTFKDYLNAKKRFFDDLDANAFCLTNLDDRNGKVMQQNTSARKIGYALRSAADYKGKVLENSFEGLVMQIDAFELHARLVGDFNAYNLLCVFAIASLCDIEPIDSLKSISSLNSAEGRFEYFTLGEKNIIGIIDYAHTPDALSKVLKTINAIRTGNEKIITVVGCGGNRDKAKRPLMSQVACENSDRVILTSDNPRNEEPEAILDEMEAGVKMKYPQKYLVNVARKQAIETAVMLAQPGDIILVAGKGHEKYQEIKGEKKPFDDREELKNAFTKLQK